jgi:Restriction endonuclease
MDPQLSMNDTPEMTDEARRTAIEVMACVPWYRTTLVEKILVPAGVPRDVYVRHLNRRDDLTGRRVSKRAAAPGILSEMEARGDGARFVRAVIQIGASWTDFHVHERVLEARAAVEMAKDFLAKLKGMERQERAREEEQRRDEERRRKAEFTQGRNLLKLQFQEFHRMEDAWERGRLLEDFLNRFFALFGIPCLKPFRRNEGGEQIDGAFHWGSHHFLVECKWKKEPSGVGEVDTLYGKVNRSGIGTMGMFLSINGWSDHVPGLLKQNREKSIILMDGYDLHLPLIAEINIRTILDRKVEALRTQSEPFFSARNLF